MRLLPRSLAAACAAAAAAAAIAGCSPATISGISPAANTSGVPSAGTTTAASPAAQASAPAGTGQAATGAVDATSAGASPAANSGSSAAVTALSIVMTLPVNLPLQTTAVIAGRLTEPDNDNAPLAGRLVWLERLGANGWLLFRSHVTGPDGGVAFQVHVVVGAAFRLVYAGTPTLDRSVSPIRIVVR
jgi:hypothetical protein